MAADMYAARPVWALSMFRVKRGSATYITPFAFGGPGADTCDAEYEAGCE
jgi:hypothetical protein